MIGGDGVANSSDSQELYFPIQNNTQRFIPLISQKSICLLRLMIGQLMRDQSAYIQTPVSDHPEYLRPVILLSPWEVDGFSSGAFRLMASYEDKLLEVEVHKIYLYDSTPYSA